MNSWIVLILLFAAGSVHARIGETKKQLEARYGSSTTLDPSEGPYESGFQKNGISIQVHMWKGVCHRIRYFAFQRSAMQRELSPPVETWGELTRSQINRLLEINGGGQAWKPENSNVRFTEGGRLRAMILGNSVIIETVEFQKHQESEAATRKETEDEKRLDGF